MILIQFRVRNIITYRAFAFQHLTPNNKRLWKVHRCEISRQDVFLSDDPFFYEFEETLILHSMYSYRRSLEQV